MIPKKKCVPPKKLSPGTQKSPDMRCGGGGGFRDSLLEGGSILGQNLALCAENKVKLPQGVPTRSDFHPGGRPSNLLPGHETENLFKIDLESFFNLWRGGQTHAALRSQAVTRAGVCIPSHHTHPLKKQKRNPPASPEPVCGQCAYGSHCRLENCETFVLRIKYRNCKFPSCSGCPKKKNVCPLWESRIFPPQFHRLQ